MRLEQIRLRRDLTTPGTWIFGSGYDEDGKPYNEVYSDCPCCGLVATTHPVAGANDAKFIANAHKDILYLLSEVDRLTKERDAAIAIHDWRNLEKVRAWNEIQTRRERDAALRE